MKTTRRNILIGIGSVGAAGVAAPYILSKLSKTEPPSMPLMTITAPGYYAITSDYTAVNQTDAAVVVAPNVHNVVILLYSRLICPTTLPTSRQNAGILFSGNNNACGVIGMGGHIRGFAYGVCAPSSDGLRIDNVNVEDALMRGIKILGNDALVRNCLIKNIYGSTYTPAQFCMGIEVSGERPKIMTNIVEEFYGTGPEPDNGEAVGISITDEGINGIVMGNVVKNARIQPKSYGYWIGGASNVSFVHNHAENMFRGAAGSSPTMGMEDENTYRNCETDFLDSGGDWLIGGRDG